MLKNILLSIDTASKKFILSLGQTTLLAIKGLKGIFIPPFSLRLILREIDNFGAGSLLLVDLIALFTGMVMALQTIYGLSWYGAEMYVGSVVSLTLVRELGPVLTSIMVGARVGSGIAAEIGSMQVTEQIDAMRALGASPIKKLVTPKILAGMITLPLLTITADIIGIFGGMLIAIFELEIDRVFYLNSVLTTLKNSDLISGTGKTVFAEALAGEYGYNLLFVSGSELESKWVGESKDRLAKVFARAKQLRPCIVALDEIDSFLETKGAITHQKEQTGYMQSVMSKPEEGVYVIATTNNPHYLKEAMLDRFPYKIFFPLPVGKEQEAVWRQYAPEGITSEEMVQDGLSCRTIAHACEKAKTYGFASKEAIQRLVKSKVVDDMKNRELATTIGDDVADYKALEEEHA